MTPEERRPVTEDGEATSTHETLPTHDEEVHSPTYPLSLSIAFMSFVFELRTDLNLCFVLCVFIVSVVCPLCVFMLCGLSCHFGEQTSHYFTNPVASDCNPFMLFRLHFYRFRSHVCQRWTSSSADLWNKLQNKLNILR